MSLQEDMGYAEPEIIGHYVFRLIDLWWEKCSIGSP